MLLLTVVNLALCAREERLRRTEMVRSAQELLSNCDGEEQALVEDFNIIRNFLNIHLKSFENFGNCIKLNSLLTAIRIKQTVYVYDKVR